MKGFLSGSPRVAHIGQVKVKRGQSMVRKGRHLDVFTATVHHFTCPPVALDIVSIHVDSEVHAKACFPPQGTCKVFFKNIPENSPGDMK